MEILIGMPLAAHTDPSPVTPPPTGAVTVNSQAELAAAAATATPGSVIELTGAVQNATLSLTGITMTPPGLTIRQAPGARIRKFDLQDCAHIRLDGLIFEWDNQAGSDFGASGFSADQAYALVINTSQSIEVVQCQFDMDPTQTGTRQAIASLKKRPGAIRSTGSSGEIGNCHFARVRDGLVLKSGTWNVHHNHGQQIFEDFCTGDATHWVFDDNSATLFEGSYVRTYTVASTAGLNIGETFVKGPQVIEIHAILNGTTLHGQINNYDLPSTGVFAGTGAAAGKSLTVTATGGEVAGLNIHGDMFQPLLLSGSASYQLIARRNIGYRSLAYDTNAICQEANTQFILAQRNGGSGSWDPCIITHNISALGQPYGIKLQHGRNGNLDYNSILWGQRGIRSDIEFDHLTNMTVQFNAGDNNLGGAVDNNGGNAGVTIAGNVFVDGNNGAQVIQYASPYTYPQTRVSFAPLPGGVVDGGNAGALTTTGQFR